MARARPVQGLHPRATLLENARAIVAVRVAEMFGFAHAVGDPSQDEDLHNMRIAAKRLRYTLEMFQVCLGPDGPELINAVREIQERIGVIHDADVLISLVQLRMGVVAHRQTAAMTAAAESGPVDERLTAVRSVVSKDGPLLGLGALLARTSAEREQNETSFTAWWSEHGGERLRARLDSALLDDAPAPSVEEHRPVGQDATDDQGLTRV